MFVELFRRIGGKSVIEEGRRAVQGGNGARLRLRQHLFSLYIHPGPDDTGYGPTSLFHGREVPHRVQAREFLLKSPCCYIALAAAHAV